MLNIRLLTTFYKHMLWNFFRVSQIGVTNNVNSFCCRACNILGCIVLYYNNYDEKNCWRMGSVPDGGGGGRGRGEWRCMQPQRCYLCNKMFSNSGNLRQHISNVHMPGERVPCNVCFRLFKNKEYLRKHHVQTHNAPLRRQSNKPHNWPLITRLPYATSPKLTM